MSSVTLEVSSINLKNGVIDTPDCKLIVQESEKGLEIYQYLPNQAGQDGLARMMVKIKPLTSDTLYCVVSGDERSVTISTTAGQAAQA